MAETATPPPRMELQWDLSRSHRVEDVDWPADRAGTQRFLEGDIRLTLKLPGRTLRAELADVRVERQGGEVTVLQLRGHPQTLDEVHAEVQKRMKEHDLPRRDLDQWYQDAKSGDFRKDRTFATRRNDLVPALSLEVRHSYQEDRPWYLSWEVAWPTLAEPAPRPPR
jgi:hypothetical protein